MGNWDLSLTRPYHNYCLLIEHTLEIVIAWYTCVLSYGLFSIWFCKLKHASIVIQVVTASVRCSLSSPLASLYFIRISWWLKRNCVNLNQIRNGTATSNNDDSLTKRVHPKSRLSQCICSTSLLWVMRTNSVSEQTTTLSLTSFVLNAISVGQSQGWTVDRA